MDEQSSSNGNNKVFEKKITLGNVIQLIVLFITLILAYSRLQHSQEALDQKFESQKYLIDKLEQALNQQYVRADVHNEQIKSINGKLQEIQDDIKDIKRTLRR